MRSLCFTLCFFVATLLAPPFLFAQHEKAPPAIPQSQVNMVLKKASKHVYYVQGYSGIATDNEGFISNAAAIISDKGIVIVDALGTPSLAQLFLTKIRQVSNLPITHVIATHYHADHIYGLQIFKTLGATIIAPEGYEDYLDAPIAKQRLEERQMSLDPFVNESTRLIRPDQVIDQKTIIKSGSISIELNYLGAAHSDGDLTVYVPADKVLVSGDLIFEGRVPFTGSADTRHWLELLEEIDNSNLNVLIPGHGGVAKDPNAAVKLTLHYLQSLRSQMQSAVDEMMTFDEAYEAADWSEFEKLPAFQATHRKNAFGVFLSLEAESME